MADYIVQYGQIDAGSGNLGRRGERVDVSRMRGTVRAVLKAPAGWSSATVSLKSLLLADQPGEATAALSVAQNYTADTDTASIDISDEAIILLEVTVAGSDVSVPVSWMLYAIDA